MEPVWKVELFGGVRAVRGGVSVGKFRIQKAASLLGYLAYYRRSHPRELLIEQFWDDEDQQTGRHRLSVALSALRQVLEPEGIADGSVIEADRNTVRLAPGSVITDVEEFDHALRQAAEGHDQATHLSRAIELYQGELLAGYYENWIFTEQQRCAHRFLEALQQLVTLQVDAGNTSGAVETALRAVGADPLSEALHLEVMRLQLTLDRPAAALRQYREVERILREELDTLPSAAFKPLLRAARAALEAGAQSGTVESGRKEVVVHTSPADLRTIKPLRREAAASIQEPVRLLAGAPLISPHQGALAIGSPFYVTRHADRELQAAIASGSSIVLLKGARQVGKTSLLGRALQQAREAGAHTVSTDFQVLSGAELESPGTLLLALAVDIVDQLDLDIDPHTIIVPERSPSVGFRRLLRREVLPNLDRPLVWGLDQVDRLFSCEYYCEIFALFRSWHNQRVLDPAGHWHRLTQVIAYATEAHLFITDLQQSPFNVGVRVEMDDFSRQQVAELNRKYGSPLRDPEELDELYGLLGGHPYLVQQGFTYAARGGGWSGLREAAVSDEGPFADHLRRLLLLVGRSPELFESIREVVRGRACPTLETFVRLRSSGILSGHASDSAHLRCRLYTDFLSLHL